MEHRIRSDSASGNAGRRWSLVLAVVAGMVCLAAGPRTGHAGDYFEGERIYGDECEQCHGSRGRGFAAGAPDFSAGEGLMRSDSRLHGVIAEGTPGMPGFSDVLTDQEILDVITYVRSLQR